MKDIITEINRKGLWGQGYGVQQRQAEIAAVIQYLLPYAKQYRHFLEIGAAAGGTARLLHDFLSFDSIHIVDDNALKLHGKRRQNIPQAVEWIGDSCSDECRAAVAAWGIRFDLIHIDAGHTYECVSSDTRLAVSVAAPLATIILHDVLCRATGWCQGVRQWVAELQRGAIPGLEYVTTFGDDLGIGVFQWIAK